MSLLKMALPKSIIIGIITLMISSHACLGQTKIEQFNNLLNKYHEYGQLNGSVLVAMEGEIVYKKGFGLANMEWDIPNKPNTKHRIGSMTKQFTAALILQLAAKDKLELHLPISNYLPDYPKENGDRVTIHHLLTHSSGIPNYTSMPEFLKEGNKNPYRPDEFIKIFSKKALEFIPGDKFSYSNSGYFLLGLIIEKVSGKTYEQMLQDNIFAPLGMENTGYDHHKGILKKRATGYERAGTNFVHSSYIDMSIPFAAGALYSTVEDLYIWDQVLYTDKLLPREYMNLYFESYIPAIGGFDYTYGWLVGNEAIGNTTDSIAVIYHGGGINGFNSIISRSTSDRSLVILLNNTGSAPLRQMTQSIRGILNGKTYDLPKKSLAYDLLTVIQTKGIEMGMEYFNTNQDSDAFDLDENQMDQIGYQLMDMGKIEEAAKVFKLNIGAFPKSLNVHNSYAEALMNLGENEEAIKNYKISIEMNPANQNGIDMLKKLGVDTDDLVIDLNLPQEILKSYIGKYELMPGFVITITKHENQMKAQASGQPMLDIFAKSLDVFYSKAIAAQITFNKDDTGKIESLTLIQGGREMIGKKITE